MAKYELGFAEHELEELGIILRAWERNRDSDSVSTQDFRSREFKAGEDIITELVYAVQPEHRLVLTVGDHPVEGYQFRKGTNGFNRSTSVDLEPREELQLRKVRAYWSRTPGIEPTSDLYVGHLVMINLKAMAKTLTNGGELSIVEVAAIEQETTAAMLTED